ncbi:MAG: amino acid racemase [bacterium]|nr:amino acid racemase [bacterium]
MKTIGLIGGTGWLSTLDYYRIINETINEKRGGLNAARCILYSFNYADIDVLNKKNDIPGVYALVLEAAKKVAGAGADCLVLCANTLHRFAEDLEKEIPLPIVHIAEAAAKQINRKGMSRVGLLGTKQTMELDFYVKKLKEKNIETLVPDESDWDFINGTIMNELLKGIFAEASRERFLGIMSKLENRGARGIILGCTEIPLLIKQEHTHLPLFNTTILHAEAAAEFAVSGE